MIMLSPFCLFKRLARVLICETVSAGVSSIKRLSLCKACETTKTLLYSSSLTSPLRIASERTCACSEIIRVAYCAADISREKTATTSLSSISFPSVSRLLLTEEAAL